MKTSLHQATAISNSSQKASRFALSAVPIGSICALAGIGFLLVLAIILTIIPHKALISAADKDIEVNLTVNPVLSAAIVDFTNPATGISSVSMAVIPNTNGAFTYGQARLLASSNSSTGFSIYLSDQDNNTAMVHATNSTATIPTLTSTTTQSSFPVNRWGHCFNCSDPANSATTFYPVPPASSTAYDQMDAATQATYRLYTTDTVANLSFPLAFAAKVNLATTAGSYSDDIVYTLVANSAPASGPTFFPDGLTTMQNLTPEICASVTTPDKAAATIVTTKATYTDASTQVPQVTLTDTRDNKTYQVRKLADGECWMAQNLQLAAGVALDSSNTDNPADGFSMTASSSWGYATTTPYLNTTGSASNGYWYNWSAATANTGNNLADGDAPGSICPKNWGLPTWTQFGTLKDTYGSTGPALSARPVSMPYAGLWYNTSSLYVGQNGEYWSSTIFDGANHNSRNLDFDNGHANAYIYYQFCGYSVRCLIK